MKPAPKITKEFCHIDWSRDAKTLYNHIRGLSPYPAAHTQLRSDDGTVIDLKVFAAKMESCPAQHPIGTVVTDSRSFLKIALGDGFLHLTEVQQAGKRRMAIADFLRGTPLFGHWKTA